MPGLDVTARELAGMYPDLGIGRGYDPDGPDDDDYAGRLWAVLPEPDPVASRRSTTRTSSAGPPSWSAPDGRLRSRLTAR